MLWGMMGVGLPVLAHLLNLHRFRQTQWAAMRFLKRAAQVRSRQIRLKDILLMLLRCLIVALTVFALSRPVTRSEGAAAALGQSRAGVVIAIDGSYSMLHQTGERSRFDRALDRAREIADTVREGDPISLILVGARHRVLLRNAAFEPERFEEQLNTLSPLSEHAALETLPGTIQPLLSQMTAAQKEVYFVTDLQASDWNNLNDEAYAEFRQLSETARVSLVSIKPGSEENAAITDFRLASGALRSQTLARYIAEVKNFGTQPQQNLRIVCRINDTPVDEKSIAELAPGESKTVTMFVPLRDPGRARLKAELSQDELMLDNTRYAVANIRKRIAVLSIDGNPAGGRFAGADDFLISALTLPQNLNASQSMNVESLPWSAMSDVEFDQYDIIVLANVAEFPEALASPLKQFVSTGGGLVVFVGPNTRPEIWNDRLGTEGVDLLAGQIGDPAEEPFGNHDGWPLDPALTDHDLAEPLQGLPEDLLGNIRFWRYMQIEPAADAQVALRIAPDGEPLLVERRIGRGRSILVATTANRDWHNMVLNPAYPMLMQQMAAHLTRQDLEIPVPVGQPIVVALDDMKVGADVKFIEPSGQATIEPTIERQGHTIGLFEPTDELGFHEIECEVASPSFVVAVNPRTMMESNVQVLTGESLIGVTEKSNMELIPRESSTVETIRTARIGREMWLPLLILAVIALGAEMLMANKLTGRRNVAERIGTDS